MDEPPAQDGGKPVAGVGSKDGDAGSMLPAIPACTSVFTHAIFDIGFRYVLEKEVGFGTYGMVSSGHDTVTKRKIAVKKISHIFDREVLTRRTLREIRLLRHFGGHANIIELRDVLMPHCALERGARIGPRGIPRFEDVYVVQDLMETDLQRLINSDQPLSNEHIRYFVYQILRGLKYIHSASVLHRDIKPGNLLLDANCNLKICDFGMARGAASTPEQQSGFMTAYVATRWYRAPEIMLSSGEYTYAVDVWSVGCIFAELLARRPLFAGRDYVHQLNLIVAVLGTPTEAFLDNILNERVRRYVRSLPKRTPVPLATLFPGADPLAVDLVSKMISFDPSQRINAETALAHPYLEKYHDVDDEPTCAPPKFNIDEPEGGDLRLAVALELGKQQRMELGLLKNATPLAVVQADDAKGTDAVLAGSDVKSTENVLGGDIGAVEGLDAHSNDVANEDAALGEKEAAAIAAFLDSGLLETHEEDDGANADEGNASGKRKREEGTLDESVEPPASASQSQVKSTGNAPEAPVKTDAANPAELPATKRAKTFTWATDEALLQRFREQYQRGSTDALNPVQKYAEHIARIYAERREAAKRLEQRRRPMMVGGVPFAPPPTKTGIGAIAARAAAVAARRRMESEAKEAGSGAGAGAGAGGGARAVFAGSLPPAFNPVLDIALVGELKRPSTQSAEIIDTIARDLRQTIDGGAAGGSLTANMSPLIPGIEMDELFAATDIDMKELQQDLEMGGVRL